MITSSSSLFLLLLGQCQNCKDRKEKPWPHRKTQAGEPQNWCIKESKNSCLKHLEPRFAGDGHVFFMSQMMDVTFGNFMKKQRKTTEIKQKWGKNTKSQQMGFNREEKTKRITDFFGFIHVKDSPSYHLLPMGNRLVDLDFLGFVKTEICCKESKRLPESHGKILMLPTWWSPKHQTPKKRPLKNLEASKNLLLLRGGNGLVRRTETWEQARKNDLPKCSIFKTHQNVMTCLPQILRLAATLVCFWHSKNDAHNSSTP